MSGNSTRLGVGLAECADWVLTPLMLILSFVAGVVLASRIGCMEAVRRQRMILLLVAALLAAGAMLAIRLEPLFALMLVAAAMGAENLVFAEGSDVRFGLTCMTGTLVRIGQRISDALGGSGNWARHGL